MHYCTITKAVVEQSLGQNLEQFLEQSNRACAVLVTKPVIITEQDLEQFLEQINRACAVLATKPIIITERDLEQFVVGRILGQSGTDVNFK